MSSRVLLIVLVGLSLTRCGADSGSIEARTRNPAGQSAEAKGSVGAEPKIKINGKSWDGKSDLDSAGVQVLGF